MEEIFTGDVQLRDVIEEDLPVFFVQQLNSAANYMAAFTAKDPTDRDAFTTHWIKIFGDKTIKKKTILFKDHIVGHISNFEQFGVPAVSYWIGKEYWGNGIATKALSQFLSDIDERPLYARAAKDNIASIRVLQKCGFKISGEDKGFSDTRGEEVEEFILILDKNDQ